jgi:hypothetical protein
MSVQMAVETNGTKAVPVELIPCDITTAAIDRLTAKGGRAILEARCYLDEIGDAGEPRLKLRLCAEWVVVVESPNGTAP